MALAYRRIFKMADMTQRAWDVGAARPCVRAKTRREDVARLFFADALPVQSAIFAATANKRAEKFQPAL